MKIAIVKLSALGDIIHAMVILQFIKKYNKSIEVDWVVEEVHKELLELHPGINKVLVVNFKEVKKKKSIRLLYKELMRVRRFDLYDLVIDMQGLIKSAVVSRFIPSKVTIGFEKSSVREGIASFFYNKTFKFPYHKNVIERNFEIVKFALNMPYNFEDVKYKLPFLYFQKKYSNLAISNNKKNIILIPGASFSSKRYPIKNFAKLTYSLDANYIIVWGNDEEKLLANKIKNLAPHVNICKKLSIESLIYLISQADLIIGPDSGPTHMGWALNVPSITLFGSTPGPRNALVTNDNKIIESNSDVNPYRINKNDNSIRNIKVEEIVKTARSLLR